MRHILAAVRAAFVYLVSSIALLVYVCGLSPTALGQNHTFDGKTLILHGDARAPIATVVFTLPVSVVIDPSHRYQWAREEGSGYSEGTRVVHDYYEVTRERLKAPASRVGWRNPLRLDRYFLPVNQYTGPDMIDGRAFLDVRASARGDFLIVVTTIHKAEVRR